MQGLLASHSCALCACQAAASAGPCLFTCAPKRAGDLFAALLLGWLHKNPGDLKAALDTAVAGLQAVLQGTVQACGDAAAATERTSAVSAARELRLVQHQGAIVRPDLVYGAEGLE
jgi:pyridoxine kinase